MLNLKFFLLLSSLAACSDGEGRGRPHAATSAPEGVPVCWEDEGFTEEKLWVQDALERQYRDPGLLNLTGFNLCTAANKDTSIRIAIADMAPHTKDLGVENLLGKPHGVTLNMTFRNANRSCQKKPKECITGIAVHEFGHVAGLPDLAIPMDSHCPGLMQKTLSFASDHPVLVQDSVMNYCNPRWMSGVLSASDKAALRAQHHPEEHLSNVGS